MGMEVEVVLVISKEEEDKVLGTVIRVGLHGIGSKKDPIEDTKEEGMAVTLVHLLPGGLTDRLIFAFLTGREAASSRLPLGCRYPILFLPEVSLRTLKSFSGLPLALQSFSSC